jgi:hypothetical protein
MVDLTRAEWTAATSKRLHRRRCPVCGSTMHGHELQPDGVVLAYCHHVNRDVVIAKVAIPAHFADDLDAPDDLPF